MQLRWCVLLCMFCGLSSAYVDAIEIKNAWARPTFALATTAAVYLVLENKHATDDTLLNVRVDNTIAAAVELHDTVHKNDMISMQQIPLPFVIPAASEISFTPGGKHIMLLGLSGPLNSGNSVSLIFEFAQAGLIQADISIQGEADTNDRHSHHHH